MLSLLKDPSQCRRMTGREIKFEHPSCGTRLIPFELNATYILLEIVHRFRGELTVGQKAPTRTFRLCDSG